METVNVVLMIIGAIVAIYEVLVRFIPSIGNNSIIAFIIDVLKWISDRLNNNKKFEDYTVKERNIELDKLNFKVKKAQMKFEALQKSNNIKK